MTRWYKVSLLLSLFLLAGVAGVAAQTEDDRVISLLYLNSDEPLDYTFEGTNATLFFFRGAAGDVVDVSMTQFEDSTLDPALVLLGPGGEVIAFDDDSGEAPLSSYIEGAELPVDGEYLIVASDATEFFSPIADDSTADGQSFTLMVSGNSVEITPDDAFFDLNNGNISIGESVEGYSDLEIPVYYFYLPLYAGETVDITTSDTDYDTLMMLFDPLGDRADVNDDSEAGDLSSAILGYEAPEDGLYLIFVTGYTFLSQDYEGGNFTLNVTITE
ncbi:MAG: hypothetical protein KME04_05615 [Pleurocapsa minor GSE-CHR-MK-17-07R]|jgi:hypothetical protein|nr:hypothetical protein [Pleurocapsa minor GSE-CHR-MK 17-07R]